MLKSTITEKESSLEVQKQIEQVRKKMRNAKIGQLILTRQKGREKKRIKKNKQSITYLWDTIQQGNTSTMVILEKKENTKARKNIQRNSG